MGIWRTAHYLGPHLKRKKTLYVCMKQIHPASSANSFLFLEDRLPEQVISTWAFSWPSPVARETTAANSVAAANQTEALSRWQWRRREGRQNGCLAVHEDENK